MLPLTSTARTSTAWPAASATGPVYLVHEPTANLYLDPRHAGIVRRGDRHGSARDKRGRRGRDLIDVVERPRPRDRGRLGLRAVARALRHRLRHLDAEAVGR